MTAAEFWEDRYATTAQVWSGRVNATLVDIVSALPPQRALELGCGEGGDAIWLAEQGWTVAAVDISPTAIARGREAAEARGVADKIAWHAADLSTWHTADRFELVTASFLQSPVELDTAAILREAADRVVPGGHLLVVAHAAPPPWASEFHRHHHDFHSPEEQWEQLELGTDWRPVAVEIRNRTVTGPDGQPAELSDTVVLGRRER